MTINQTITLCKSAFDNAECGSECRFIRTVRFTSSNDGQTMIPWGLKVYPQLIWASRAQRSQLKFASLGLAPLAGELVRVKFRHLKTTYYAYFTERIDGNDAAQFLGFAFKTIEHFPVEYHLAVRQLKANGYTDLDEHHHNIMFCERRLRWLAVDFGELSSTP